MASGRRTGFPWNMFWIVFLLWTDLYCSALPTPTVKDSNKVHVCPNNKTEWQKASKRLNCTDIASNTKNRYHCLPVHNLSALMEFCYNETRPRITPGLCIAYVPESNAMNSHKCSTFDYGCPDRLYLSDEIYAFPSCGSINPIDRCYVANSFCPPTPANERITKDSAFLSIVIVLYAFFISFVAGIVGLILYKNRIGKKEDGKTKVGEKKLREFLRKEKIDISHIRCIIVGCAHAGKTTFLRRLENTQFNKLKNEVKSTEMADIYVNMFEVSEDRETIESVKNKSPTVIFSPNMVHNYTKVTQEIQLSTDIENQMHINDGDMPSNEFKTKDSDQNRDNTDTELDGNMMELSTIEATDTSSTHSYEKTSLLNGKNYSLQNRTEKSHRSNSTDFARNYGHCNDEKYAMSKIIEALEQLNKNPRPRITFIDFAGQSIYYAFHQIYLSPKTCYILVLDMTKGLDEKVDSDETVGSRFVSWTYRDYCKFWLRSIDSFSDPNAQVIVVGTHAEETSTERVKEFFQEFFAACSSLDLRRHLHSERCFTIGFPKPGSELEDLGDIKKCIACLVPDPESIRPIWAIFEQIFEKQKEQKIISRNMLSLWNNAISKDLQMNETEISEMLLFFHRVGTLLYFEENNLKETIILDIQWFSDAFKSIVAYHVDIKESDIERVHFQNTGELDDPILEKIWRMEENKKYTQHKDVILAYMEQLGLVAICNTESTDNKEIITWYYIPSMNKRKFEINDKEFAKSSILCFQFDKQGQLPIFVFYGAIVKCMKIPGWSIFKQNGQKCIYESVACFSYLHLVVKICLSTFQIQVQVCFPQGETIGKELEKIQRSIEKILKEFKNYSFQVGYKCINGKFNAEEDNSFIPMEMFRVSGLKCETCSVLHYVESKICWIKPGVHANKFSRKKEYEEVRLVIIGKKGSGKSATGNTILGEPVFESTISGTSNTRDCSHHFVERFGRKIVIVDTPGIFDTKETNAKIQEEIYKCIGITSPGPHAFIYVINAASRYTEEEQRSVEHFVNNFGSEIYKYFIVLFVRKDELDNHKIQLADQIRNAPPIMQQFIQKCGGRVCAFNNKARGREQEEQVMQLLLKISENIEKNGGNCYTNEMYRESEKQIKIKEEKRLAIQKECEKQLQSIKQAIDDNFHKMLAQEMTNIKLVQKNIDELVKKQNKNNNRIADLQGLIGVYKQMIKEKRGDQQELKDTLDLMSVELAKSRETTIEEGRLIEQYRRDMEKHKIEAQNLQRKYEENIAAEISKIRGLFGNY